MWRLGWLHLSDLHLGPHSSRLLQPEYREAFEQDLRKLHAKSGPWDVVFLSGGLTLTGNPREFMLLNSTLGSLWEFLRGLGSDPCLLAVPGPHDFWGGHVKGEYLEGQYSASDVRRAFRDKQDGSRLEQAIRDGFSPFNTWFNGWRQTSNTPLMVDFRPGLLPGDFAATLRTPNVKMGVIGLNSNLKSSSIFHEVNVAQLDPATGGMLREWSRQHELLVLLTHHPPSELRLHSLGELGEELAHPGSILLHLCGSPHTARDSTLGEGAAGFLTLQAPSLFGETAKRRPKEEQSWGYAAGEISTAATTGRLKIFPRITSFQKGAVTLGPDLKLVPSTYEAIRIPVAELKRVPAGETRPALAHTTSLRSTEPRGTAAFLRPSPVPQAQRRPTPDGSLPTGMKLQAILDMGLARVSGLAWSPIGDTLGLGLYSGQAVWWKPVEDSPRWTVSAHVSRIADLCFSPDGQVLASRSEAHIRLWEADGTQIDTPQTLKTPGSTLAWSSRGQLVTDYGQNTLQFWNTVTWQEDEGPRLVDGLRKAYALAWSPDGQLLACGGEGTPHNFYLFRVESTGGRLSTSLHSRLSIEADVLDVAWDSTSSRLALALRNRTLLVWDWAKGLRVSVLEGHTSPVSSTSFSFDGRLLATKSFDGTIRLFRTDRWEQVARIDEQGQELWDAGIAFSPTQHVLASVGPGGMTVRLWEIDIAALLGASAASTTVHEVSAKVVLVGEGRAGKSCLAQRMVKGTYEELDSTHGMRFWSMPSESPTPDAASAKTRRELILWDLGGQSEYQLVHQLFLRDSTAALMVMEPGRGDRALEELEGWNRRLLAQAGERHIRKILVGAKVDSPESPVNRPALEGLVQRLGFDTYVLTSAKEGHGIPELKTALGRAIDWNAIERVSRPELFQRMRQLIQRLRETRRVVLSFSELEVELRRELGAEFDPEALRAVVGHLARQGLVADTRMAGGTRVLILEVEQLERYAGSLIVAARDNPQGVPAIEVAQVLSPRMKFPRIKDEERLREDQELPVLNCVIELLIEHGLCLRHEGLLIFPSLFQPTHEESSADFSHAISLQYDFFGPIDNIYASLVTSLAMSQRFGPMRLWESRAEFGEAGKDSSGIRRVQNRSQGARGFARLDVYFDEGTDAKTRDLFVNFIERHLREQGVELRERLGVTCVCGKAFTEETVRQRLAEEKTDIGCESCDRRTPLTLSRPELDPQIQALRTNIHAQRKQTVTEVIVTMSGETSVKQPGNTPIRILHLSDLHIGAEDDAPSLRKPLMMDLRDRHEGLGIERLDYLVISGDITNRASPQEFAKAYEFVSGLIDAFELTAQRCIIVPGNHDLDWGTPAYRYQPKREVNTGKLTRDSFVDAGPGYLVRDEAKYPERFKHFSEHFYHRLTQKPYPLAAEEQCLPFLFADDGLQFLAMNSAWEIDEHFRERSSISEKALARGLDAADRELSRAQTEGKLAKDARVLRLAVWHHPITGNEKIQADAFLGQLQRAQVRLCLHGHVHEERTELLNYLDPRRTLHVIGGGSFGAPTHERPESVPRLYNLLEVRRDLQHVEVHTRGLRKQGGTWEAYAVWPSGKPGMKRSSYDVPLTS